jgi:hypothetical protein
MADPATVECMARRPRAAAATALVALLIGVGCAGDSASPDTTTVPPASTTPVIELPDDVEVAVEFPRYLQVDREELEVVVDNQSGFDIEVADVALRSPLFQLVEARAHTTNVRVGRRVDIKVRLGASLCPAPAGASHVELTTEVDGVRSHGLVAVDAGPLEAISATDCGRELVRQHVDVAFSPDFVVEDGVVVAQLALERLEGDDAIAVDAVRGSVLLELRADAATSPLGVLTPGDDTTTIPVQLRVVRCDPHAVIESKKTFQLSAWVALGDADPQHLIVVPDGDLRAALEALIQDCLRAQAG